MPVSDDREVKSGALIGCGFFARNHMHGWADAKGARIMAVCDKDAQKAERFAADFSVPHVFTDAAQMLAALSLDFVDVVTTPPSHRPLVELVASHQCPVICQKPIADSYADAAAMVAAAKAAGVPFAIHENFRWQKAFVAMKRLIDEGRIGTPHFARFSFRHGYDNYRNQPYLMEIERFSLMDVGIHLYDIARHFMGEVDRLTCHTQRVNPAIRGEDAFVSLLVHENGGVSEVDCSFQSIIRPEPFPETIGWIEGDKGSVGLTTDMVLCLHTADGRQDWVIEPAPRPWLTPPWHNVQDSVANFEAHFVDVLNGRTHPQPSGEDNLKTLALSLASYDAARTGETIKMADWTET